MSHAKADNTPLTTRLLHAGDRPAIEHFFLVEMDDVSLYWRFFRTMTPMTVNVYVTQMRFDNGCVAYGAFFDERLVGVAELSAIPGSETCAENRPGSLSCGELGIAVSNHLHHKGIGRQLLTRLLDDAWTRGLKRIQLSSLRDNRPMLALAARLGFKPLREESGEIIMQALRPADWPQAVPRRMKQSAAPTAEREINCSAKVVNARCR